MYHMVLCQLPDQRHSTLGTVDVTTDSNGQTVTAVTLILIMISKTDIKYISGRAEYFLLER